MLSLLNKLKSSEKGDVLVEFATTMPFLLLLFMGLTEVGRAFLEANALEKSLRVGAVYAARVDNPTATASRTVIENLVKTGTIDGSGALLSDGWENTEARLDIIERTYDMSGDDVPVVTLTAYVPFKPMVPDLMAFVGLNDFVLTVTHEQAYVDD